MQFNFEKFTETTKRFAPFVTVRQRTGQLGFNSGAVNFYGIRRFKYVVMYFDATNRAVRIDFTSRKQSGAMVIVQRESNTFVPTKRFMDRYGIDYQESHRHPLKALPGTYGLCTYFLLGDASDKWTDEVEPI